MSSPALDALNKKKTIDIYETETDLKITKPDSELWCSRHFKAKKNGRCLICDIEKKHRMENERRIEAIESGDEKWIKNTCFKKDRQTKKYVMKMMDLTGKQYRKLKREAKRKK